MNNTEERNPDEELIQRMKKAYGHIITANFEEFLNGNFSPEVEYILMGRAARPEIKLIEHCKSRDDLKNMFEESWKIYDYTTYDPFEFHSTKDGKFLTVLVRAFGKFKSDGALFRHDLVHLFYLDKEDKIRLFREYMIEHESKSHS